MTMSREKLVLVDGHSILNRAFYGMPDLTNVKGVHTGAVYGFLNILFHILDEEQAQYLIVAFDVHAPTFRHKVYSDYKGTRKPMPEELREQVPLIKEVLHSMDIETCEQAGLEADDILGTLANNAERDGLDVSLVSGDRDLLQIASDHIRIRIPKTKRGQTVIEDYYAADVKEAYQVTPKQFIDVKALMGDTADNIPGVPKVGPKTATELIVTYGSVDGVYEHLDEIKRPSLKKNLAENEDKARLSLFLATIKTDCDLPIDRAQAKITNFYTPSAFKLFTELGFKNFLPRFAAEDVSAKEKALTYRLAKGDAEAQPLFSRTLGFASDADKEPVWIGICPLYDPVPYGSGQERTARAGAVADPDGLYFVSDTDLAPFLSKLRRRAAADSAENIRIAVFDIKNQYAFWGVNAPEEFHEGIRLGGMFDLLLGAYLCNPLKSDYEPEDIANEYLGLTIPTAKQLFGKKVPARCLEEMRDAVEEYCCRLADTYRKSAPKIWDKLSEQGLLSLYRTIERPLTYVLYDMERIGITIHPEALRAYSRRLGVRITELENQIYEETGTTFNIASPKQLGSVLFEKMGLPGGKKTKTGYSTAASVLEKLAPEYPVVNDILEYRALTKLKSTYADGLTAFVTQDGKIHTTFKQTITATGRLSSADPNLQNIPMRTDLGKQIRKAFVPVSGYTFTDADYSQIELRILAHMSGDESLIEAYRENRDIHRITASKVFHTPFEEVTDLQRRNAKAVNFGIVYGISSFGLGQDLHISRKEAQDYINAYFRTYPDVKKFLDRLVAFAKENGYAVTMFGRRRPIPELKSSNFAQRQFGERVAMNAPIQGSAADIMKIAMIRVWESLCRKGLSSQLILQIHDELLIETAPGEEETVRALLEEGMKGAADLKVTLEVDTHSGNDWYLAK